MRLHDQQSDDETAQPTQGTGFIHSKTFVYGAFAVAIIVIIWLTINYRTYLLQFYGFYEPDGFYHYSVIRAAVNNHFIIPKALGISGWPQHAPVGEPDGLYWVTLIPYYFLQGTGISYYNLMRDIPLLYALLDVFGAYFLARYISKDKLFGLFAMLLVALSMGDAARTSATIYRGDSFVSIFLIVALIFLIKIFKTEDRNRKILFTCASGFFLAICNVVWNGGPFATATYVFAFSMLLALAFIFDKEKMLHDSGYMIAALVVWFLIVQLFLYLGYMSAQTFTGVDFIPLLSLLFISWLLTYYLTKNRAAYLNVMKAALNRFAIMAAILILALVIFVVALPSTVTAIFVTNGFANTGNFASTIQELQPPTPDFLFASFGYAIYASPMSIIMLATTYLQQTSLTLFIMWAVLLASFIPYLFMQVYDSGRWLASGNARFMFDVNEGMVILISYFALTAYLQMHAIRFNSLVSIPLAIFCAYTIYWLALFFFSNTNRAIKFAGTSIIVILTVVLIAGIIYFDNIYSVNLTQADEINPAFVQALQWLHNNTTNNSVVLTLWPDGSLVEGVANRTSVTDSVGSQNGSKALPFATWILNSSDDPQFLTSNINGKPNYLLVRFPWLVETQGIFVESGLNSSVITNYGYVYMGSYQERSNATDNLLALSPGSSPGSTGSTIVDIPITSPNTVTNRSIRAYSFVNGQLINIRDIAFYDQDNGGFFAYVNNNDNNSVNQTLLVEYTGAPRPGAFLNVTGAYLFATGIANSNMIKFLFFCSPTECAWNNNIATAQLVYANPDTKIFKLSYNSTT